MISVGRCHGEGRRLSRSRGVCKCEDTNVASSGSRQTANIFRISASPVISHFPTHVRSGKFDGSRASIVANLLILNCIHLRLRVHRDVLHFHRAVVAQVGDRPLSADDARAVVVCGQRVEVNPLHREVRLHRGAIVRQSCGLQRHTGGCVNLTGRISAQGDVGGRGEHRRHVVLYDVGVAPGVGRIVTGCVGISVSDCVVAIFVGLAGDDRDFRCQDVFAAILDFRQIFYCQGYNLGKAVHDGCVVLHRDFPSGDLHGEIGLLGVGASACVAVGNAPVETAGAGCESGRNCDSQRCVVCDRHADVAHVGDILGVESPSQIVCTVYVLDFGGEFGCFVVTLWGVAAQNHLDGRVDCDIHVHMDRPVRACADADLRGDVIYYCLRGSHGVGQCSMHGKLAFISILHACQGTGGRGNPSIGSVARKVIRDNGETAAAANSDGGVAYRQALVRVVQMDAVVGRCCAAMCVGDGDKVPAFGEGVGCRSCLRGVGVPYIVVEGGFSHCEWRAVACGHRGRAVVAGTGLLRGDYAGRQARWHGHEDGGVVPVAAQVGDGDGHRQSLDVIGYRDGGGLHRILCYGQLCPVRAVVGGCGAHDLPQVRIAVVAGVVVVGGFLGYERRGNGRLDSVAYENVLVNESFVAACISDAIGADNVYVAALSGSALRGRDSQGVQVSDAVVGDGERPVQLAHNSLQPGIRRGGRVGGADVGGAGALQRGVGDGADNHRRCLVFQVIDKLPLGGCVVAGAVGVGVCDMVLAVVVGGACDDRRSGGEIKELSAAVFYDGHRVSVLAVRCHRVGDALYACRVVGRHLETVGRDAHHNSTRRDYGRGLATVLVGVGDHVRVGAVAVGVAAHIDGVGEDGVVCSRHVVVGIFSQVNTVELPCHGVLAPHLLQRVGYDNVLVGAHLHHGHGGEHRRIDGDGLGFHC